MQDGAVTRRTVSLDGSGREFIRRGTELMCYLPDQRTVLVEQRPKEGMLLGSLPRIDDATAQYYDIRSVERSRIMGRDARLVAVTPRDEFRYGYRLWIDERTAMPLKTQLCDGKGHVIEQIVFASLVLPERIGDAEFQPAVAAEGYRWLRNDPARGTAGEPAGDSALWSAMRLPPGFRMTTRSNQGDAGRGCARLALVFSDGVASVSVFVEPRPAAAGKLDGEVRMGSSSAFSPRSTAARSRPSARCRRRRSATSPRRSARSRRGAARRAPRGAAPAFAPPGGPRR
ncbi:MAG: MucB/RseB C-terminal domain-containing protein [Steroidobacteraceae bacterium]